VEASVGVVTTRTMESHGYTQVMFWGCGAPSGAALAYARVGGADEQ